MTEVQKIQISSKPSLGRQKTTRVQTPLKNKRRKVMVLYDRT